MIEVSEQRRIRRRGLQHWAGIRTYVALSSSAMSDAAVYYGQAWDGDGTFEGGAPICYDYRIQYAPYGLSGLALIHLYYSTSGINVLPAGQARLLTRFGGKTVRRVVDLNGKLIEGVEDGNNGVNERRVTKGDNVMVEPRTIYIVQGYYNRNEIPHAELDASINCVNHGAFINPLAGVHELWFRGGQIDEQYLGDVARVDLMFEKMPGGWNNYLQSTVGRRANIPAIGKVVGSKSPVRTWVRGERENAGVIVTEGPYTHRLFEERSFNFLSQLTIVEQGLDQILGEF